MQLFLDTDQLDFIANILLEREARMSTTPENAALQRPASPQKLSDYEELLDKILARNMEFDSDELEQLADILAAEKRDLKENISQLQEPNAAKKALLQHKLTRLERVLEKVDEVCAML